MTHEHIHTAEVSHEHNTTVFGFWIYLMSDCLLFASLFATYAVLQGSTYGGPGGVDLFSLSFVLLETVILLTSSFTSGLALFFAQRHQVTKSISALAITAFLGAFFLALEYTEFLQLVAEGNDWTRSAFLSAFFTLVGTHGVHVFFGLLWMMVIGTQLASQGLTTTTVRRLTCMTLFWHFLDIVWVCIFTFVYLFAYLL